MKCIKAAALALMLSSAAAASADTFNVSNTADSGPGSLRDAITLANATPGDDIVRFTVTGLLKPATPYPATVGKILIDNKIPATIHAIPPVDIDASNLSAPVFHGRRAAS